MCAEYSLKYNKSYIGIAKNNIANNFIQFLPRKTSLIMLFKLERNDEYDTLLDESDLDVMAYDKQWNQYRIRLKESDLESNWDVIKKLSTLAAAEYWK